MKTRVVIITIALIALIGTTLVGCTDNTSGEKGVSTLNHSQDVAAKTKNPTETVRESGGIESSDGKKLEIWLAAESGTNFGQKTWSKDKIITWTVNCDQMRELEIGIISVSTNKVTSQIVRTGTGTVNLTIPEDGDYRIYIKNNALDVANFRLDLDEKFDGPLV